MVNFDIGGETVASEGSHGLDFAKRQLEKHGWTEGKGLGKDESGRANAIKVGVKKDTFGVGFDVGKEFTNCWWDNLFNKAASNIVVEESKNGVQVSKKDIGSDVRRTKKLWRIKDKELYYGRFVKANDDVSDVSSTSEKPEVQTKFSDEELFKACDGRTAHKSARHGHKLSGKLKRIAQQEDQKSSEKTKGKRKKCSSENIVSTSNHTDDDTGHGFLSKNSPSEKTKKLDNLGSEKIALSSSNGKQCYGTVENPCIFAGEISMGQDDWAVKCNECKEKSLERKKYKKKVKKTAKALKCNEDSVQENMKGHAPNKRENRSKNELDQRDANSTEETYLEKKDVKSKRTKKKKKAKK